MWFRLKADTYKQLTATEIEFPEINKPEIGLESFPTSLELGRKMQLNMIWYRVRVYE